MRPLVSLIPEPDRSTVERKPLTAKQRAELALAQGGRCGCGCGEKLDHAREGTIDEHMNPLGLTGTNDLTNRKLFRLPCAKAKTVGDKGAIAKAKRNEARDTGTRRERKAIPGRGFGALTRKIDGSVGPTKRSLRSVADSVSDSPAGDEGSEATGVNQS